MPHPSHFTSGKDPVMRKWLGGLQNQSGEVQKFLPALEFKPQIIQPKISCYSDYASLATLR